MNLRWKNPASLITAGVSLTLLAGTAHAQTSPQQGGNTSQVQGTPTGAAAASATIVNGQYQEGSGNQGTGNQGTTGRRANNGTMNQNGRNSARSVPAGSVSGNATPILQRAAEMWRESRQRAASAPTGARESYLAAVNAFQKMFRAYGVSPGAATTGRGTTVTSGQASDDVRTLRAGRKINAASLYATGAKEFFTAQLREALLGSNTSAPIVLRGNGQERSRSMSSGQTGMASSAVQQPPVDPTMQQGVTVQPVVPVVPVVPGGVIIGPANTVIGPGNTVIGSGNQLPQFNPQPLPQLGNGLPAPGTTVLPGVPQPIQPTQPVVPVAPGTPAVPPPAPVSPPAPVPPAPGQPGTP